MKKNILVIGGTGKTGRRVAEILKREGHHVKTGGRKTDPKFDWEDFSTFAPTLNGIDRAYVVYYPDLAIPGAKEAITALTEAALAEGLEKVVLLSGKGEVEAQACEQIVANSGLDYTLVRASWFNQNFSESVFLEPVLSGHVALPMPEARIPYVDADDLAAVVSKVLIDDTFNGETLEITGPRKLTFAELMEEISTATGRQIMYHPISMAEFAEGMRSAGLPETYIWLFSYLFEEVLSVDENQYISNDIEKVLGRKAIDFSEFAKKAADSGIWNIQEEMLNNQEH